MNEKKFFNGIDFNKSWDEGDWEKFFLAQDAYRLQVRNQEVHKNQISKIRFEGSDEVTAFEPVIRAYGGDFEPEVVSQLHDRPFSGDKNPETDYHPSTDEDPHYWGEGAPLATVLIYRDCCRFAICASQEIDRHIRARDLSYRRKYSGELESLRFHANWIAINVAQGHRIGYAEDRIRGNIAKCRRAVKHAEICMTLLGRVCARTRSKRLRKELYSFSAQLRNGLFDWIEEMRLRLRAGAY